MLKAVNGLRFFLTGKPTYSVATGSEMIAADTKFCIKDGF
jgi:hypothetical protein